MNSSTLYSIFFKSCFLLINLFTGILLARSLSLSERGIGGLIFSIVTLISVWQSSEINEKAFRKEFSKTVIHINCYEQLIYLLLIVIVCSVAGFNSKTIEIFALMIASTLSSRIMAITYLNFGLIVDRLLQFLHLVFLLSGILILSNKKLLNLDNWVHLTLTIEIVFAILIFCINLPRKISIKILPDKKSIFSGFSIRNLLITSEGLADRLVILLVSTIFTSRELGIFVVAISFVLIIGSPITASYPYPIVNALDIRSQIQNLTTRKSIPLILSVVVYFITCILLIRKFVPILFGNRYLEIVDFAIALVLAGLSLGFLRYTSSVWRGLGMGLLANILQNLAIITTFVCACFSKFLFSENINFLAIFAAWSLANLFSSYLLFRRIFLSD